MKSNRANIVSYDAENQTLKTLFMALLIWGMAIIFGWALPADFEASVRSDRQTVSADSSAPIKPAEAHAAAVQPEMTQDFLTESSPLSAAQPAAKLSNADVSIVAVKGPGRDCSSSGDASEGSQNCIVRSSDGSFSESAADWENFGDESKKQTVVRHYNSNGESAGEDTIRIKTSYRSNPGNVKQKEREFYDLVNQPSQGLISRDLVVKEYNSQGELKKITWAHYVEIGTRKAGLAHHAALYYEDGKLTSGFANKYKNGKVVDTLLNYDPVKNPNLRMEKTGALKWANWIDQLIHTTAATTI